MSKVVDKENKTNNVAKTVDPADKWEDAKQALAIQLKDHLEKAEHHKTMAIKAQGAIEVYDQLFAKKENSES